MPKRSAAIRLRLAGLSGRHELVCIILHDPREERLPRAGLVRVSDPERPGGTLLVNSNSGRTRARVRRAWAARAARLEHNLRSGGADVVWMRTDRDPLRTLMQFFSGRAAAASHGTFSGRVAAASHSVFSGRAAAGRSGSS